MVGTVVLMRKGLCQLGTAWSNEKGISMHCLGEALHTTKIFGLFLLGCVAANRSKFVVLLTGKLRLPVLKIPSQQQRYRIKNEKKTKRKNNSFSDVNARLQTFYGCMCTLNVRPWCVVYPLWLNTFEFLLFQCDL